MIYLVFDNTGLIVNAIEYDGETPYDPGEGLGVVERGDSGAWISWGYDNDAFIPPVTLVVYEVDGGRVTEIVTQPYGTSYQPENGLAVVERGESLVMVGWIYDGETFVPPPEPKA